MIAEHIRDNINNGKIGEEELQILVYGFAESISKTASKLFKKKEDSDDYFIASR